VEGRVTEDLISVDQVRRIMNKIITNK